MQPFTFTDAQAESLVRALSRAGDRHNQSAVDQIQTFIDSNGEDDGIAVFFLLHGIVDSVNTARDLLKWIERHPQE